MAHNAHLLNNMNLNPEALDLARTILREAALKTKPGSGYEIGSYSTGLPAICAYIACDRLKANDVTRTNAQIASCLKKADFDKAVQTVQAAIGGSRPVKVASYQSICSKFQADEQQLGTFFRQAERALLQTNPRYNPERTVEIRFGIFFWVYNLWNHDKLSKQQFLDENKLSHQTFASILAVLEKCKALKTEIIEAKKVVATPTKAPSTANRRSPLKRPLRELPSRESLRKKRLASPESPPKSTQVMHETLNNRPLRPFPETPTKKRRLNDLPCDLSQKPIAATPLRSILRTSPRKGTTTSTPSRVKLDVARFEPEEQPDSDEEMDPSPLPLLNLTGAPEGSASDLELDSDEDIDTSMIDDAGSFLSTPNKVKMASVATRRFRPVYLDFKQWNTLDPRLQAVYARA